MFKKRLIAGFALIGVLTAAALASAQSYPPPIVPTVFLHSTLKNLSASTDLLTAFSGGSPLYWRLASSAQITGANIVATAVQAGQNI